MNFTKADTPGSCYVGQHFSHEGEDIFLQLVFNSRPGGFFVDIGAHHPIRFSNTYALYLEGWRGINIDATPGSMDAFNEVRPEDINLEYAVSDAKHPLHFHFFKEAALNTFNAELAEIRVQEGWERLEVREIIPRPLVDIIREYLPEGQLITFMTIDVEGEEMAVLRSNDWEKCAPEWLIIEVLDDVPLNKLEQHPVIAFLAPYGYTPVAKFYFSVALKKSIL